MRKNAAGACEFAESRDPIADYDVMMDALEGDVRALPLMGSARATTLAVGQHRFSVAVGRWIGSRRHAVRIAPSLSDARRRTVAARMSDAVGERFGDRLRQLTWSVDTDPASTASHELLIHVDRSGLTPEQFAAGARSLHLALVRHLEDDELQSVSLVVEPLRVRA